jgi:sugar phosphate isomerase/epimerase
MAILAMNEMTTFRWSFDQDVQNYVSAGYGGIGVWRQKLADYGEEKGIELLSDAGLSVSSVHWAGGFTGSDGRTYKESLEDARDAVRLAGDMHASCLVVYTGGRGGHTHNHARRLIKSAIKELEPLAGEAGVTLALEPMHPGCAAEWTFLTSVDDTLQLLDSLDCPRVKIILDTYHLCQAGENLEALADLAPRIAVVQLGDSQGPPNGEQNRCRLGDGAVPVDLVVARLNQAGYDGYYEVELLGEDVEADDYDTLLTLSRDFFQRVS